MLTTNELGWFYPGTIPESIELWFQENCLISPQQAAEAREDLYLQTPGNDFMGIKLRRGRFEVKWHIAELGLVGFGQLVEGGMCKNGASGFVVTLQERVFSLQRL